MRVKQFEDHIEAYPDFMTLRNHIGKTVTGEGKRAMLMNVLWRLLRATYNLPAGGKELEPDSEPKPETPEPSPTTGAGYRPEAKELPSL